MNLQDAFSRVFSATSKRLIWTRLNHVDRDLGPHIDPYEGYYSVRIAEMYLRNSRVLWRKYLPMINGLVTQGSAEQASLVGPTQLKQFGDAGLDNVLALNQPLCGPMVPTGEDFGLAVGLMAVLSQDYAQVLLDTTASVSSLLMIDLGASAKLAPVVKSAVESILGIHDIKLQMGVADRFAWPGHPLGPGLHVGIAANEGDIQPNQLRYADGRLMIGVGASSKPFDSYDYMIVLIEGRQHRPDWPSLPALAPFEIQFTDALKETTHEQRLEKLNPVLMEFINAVNASSDLSKPDKNLLPAMVSKDLQKRLDQLKVGSPLESMRTNEAARFDFLDVSEPRS
jgi:hypothetical protein